MNSSVDRTIRWDWDVVGLVLLISVIASFLAKTVVDTGIPFLPLAVFGLGTGVISLFVLKATGYFNVLKILPRQSDVLLMMLALQVGTFPMAEALNQLAGTSRLQGLQIILWTPAAAILAFSAHYLHSWILSIRSKRRIYLKLMPAEENEIREEFRAHGILKNIELLSARQALKELRKATEPDIDMIIVSRGAAREMQNDRFLLRAHLAGIPIVDRRIPLGIMTGRVRLEDMDLWSFLHAAKRQDAFLRTMNLIKLALEPVLAFALIVMLLPFFVVVAILIKATSPGPVIYSQLRTGYLGRTFRVYKFRSMRTDSEVNGVQWATKNDPRITPIGKFIRKTRLDELPQLWNVVKRDMGFIGPRPERPEIYKELRKTIPTFYLRTYVRPGITGWAQVCAGYAASVEESKLKLEFDLYYIQHMSPRLDLIVIAKTIKVILFGSEYIAPEKRGVGATLAVATAAEAETAEMV